MDGETQLKQCSGHVLAALHDHQATPWSEDTPGLGQ
jgi:hypothetical protein